MNERVLDVVERFGRLTPDEQTEAYIKIETTWKLLQQDGTLSNSETRPLRD
jgi:hypothetical protein